MTQPDPPGRTAPFRAYVAPARARAQLWRLALGLILCGAVYVAWVAGLLGAAWWASGAMQFRAWVEPVASGSTPQGTLILLGSFFGMALGPVLAARLLHKRRAGTLFGRGALVLRDFALAATLAGAVYAVSIALWAWRFDAVPNLELSLWLRLLPLALLGLLLQTGAEELVFRGYLMQQLAARFRSPLIWMALPSLIFGAVHYDPETAGANAWLLVAAAAGFGLVAADLTAVTGSLGAAWGLHFANNLAAVTVVALQGTLSGLALYTTPYGAQDLHLLPGLIAVDLAVLAATWALVRRAVRR